jgi:hypothetical protein
MIHSERTFARVAELQRQARAALPQQGDFVPTAEELVILEKAHAKVKQ